MKIEWKQRRADSGLFWSARRGGELVAAISSSYLAANNGAAFARNHGAGWVDVSASIVRPDGETRVVFEWLGRAKSRNEADKLARQMVRELVRPLVELSLALTLQQG